MNKIDLEAYIYILNKAADILEQLNKKNDTNLAELILELRTVAQVLLDEQQDEVQKSTNLITRLFNYIKSKLGA